MPNSLPSKPRVINNMWGPKVIAEFDSKYSGKLFVKSDWGNRYVTTGYLTQSGGLIHDLWNPILKNLSKRYTLNAKTWLILGLATGTVAKLINKKFKDARITGVEIDPVMIDIGKKYFDLDKIPNLEILNLDAKDYLPKTKDQFDFVLVDLYLGDQPPTFLYSPIFLNKLAKLGKLVIINHLFYDEDKKRKAQVLITSLNKYFQNIRLNHVLTNLMIICE